MDDRAQIPHRGPRQIVSSSKHNPYITPMRVHELALMNWLNAGFFVAEGYPVPSLFSKPNRAYQDAMARWAQPGGPFNYLLTAKDSKGTPLYQPHPLPLALPIIVIDRISWSPDISRTCSNGHQYRNAGWPTVDRSPAQRNLGNVYVSKMPQAWNYNYLIEYWASMPESTAMFMSALLQRMKVWGAQPYTWIIANYPGVGYRGRKLVRLIIDGDITDGSEINPDTGTMIHKVSLSIKLEGWHVDLDPMIIPAFWTETITENALDPVALASTFSTVEATDLRVETDRVISGVSA